MNSDQDTNPYKSPLQSGPSSPPVPNPVGRAGFVMSLVGILGVVMVILAEGIGNRFGQPIGIIIGTAGFIISFLSAPGLFLSCVGLSRTPRRLAGWGAVLGFVGTMQLPTFLTAFLAAFRQ